MKKLLFVILLFGSQYMMAQSRYIDSLQQVVTSHSNDTLSIDALNLLAGEYVRKDLIKMRICLYKAIATAKEFNTTRGLSSSYCLLVTTHHHTGNTDSAKVYLEKLKRLASITEEAKVKFNYYHTAGLFYKNIGNYKEALSYMLQSLKFINTKEHEINLAGQLLNIGNTWQHLGNMKEAAHYHIKALELFEKLNNRKGQSFCLQGLGNDFLKLKEYSTARKYLERC